jgi:hypothetical protein
LKSVKWITLRPHAPWYNEEIRQEKHERRKAEKRWRKTKLTVHKQLYRDKCHSVNTIISLAKKEHFLHKIEECGTNHKQLFKLMGNLMGNTSERILPSHATADQLSNRFNDFFKSKVDTIRDSIRSTARHDDDDACALDDDTLFDGVPLTFFEKATSNELKKIIVSAPSKSCILDPFPTWLMKECVDPLLPLVSAIVNTSLSSSTVPTYFKQAVVVPLLKKAGVNQDDLKNYRPVSNLPFLSKVLEKVVAKRLDDHITKYSLHDTLQSAYRQGHSTETALLKIQNDVAQALDGKSMVVLVMLDLSAAFDVIDHPILLERLQYSFGVTSDALGWIQSYLSDRRQRVTAGTGCSQDQLMECGVPQGSVLGPKAYSMYTKPVGHIIRRHGLAYHCYADDTQIYFTIKPNDDWSDVSSKMQTCVQDVGS